MAHKNATHYNTPGEIDPSVLSRGQLIQMVIDLRWRLGEQRARVDRKRELVAIHRDTVEREREAVMQVNHQLLM